MSTLEDTMTALENSPNSIEKPMDVKSKKHLQPGYHQKLQAVKARIKYREKAIKGFRTHLERGTFPKRFKSLKPYPKMGTPESQVLVDAAGQQAECVILDQMTLEEELKLKQDQVTCQTMKQERKVELTRVPRKPKMLTVVQLRQELTDLQTKYDELCCKLDNQTTAML